MKIKAFLVAVVGVLIFSFASPGLVAAVVPANQAQAQEEITKEKDKFKSEQDGIRRYLPIAGSIAAIVIFLFLILHLKKT